MVDQRSRSEGAPPTAGDPSLGQAYASLDGGTGGGSRGGQARQDSAGHQQRQDDAAAIARINVLGDNPLVRAASALLALVVHLRYSTTHADVQDLQQRVMTEVRGFEEKALAYGVRSEVVTAARYCLCTALDEAVLSTPWGGESLWSTRSLLTIFHNETWGGEKFFLILDRVKNDPKQNLHLLEMIDLLLALGFEGKYGIEQQGRYALDEVRSDTYRLIRGVKDESNEPLSPRWEAVETGRRQMAVYLPLWVIAAFTGLAALGIFLAFDISIVDMANQVIALLNSVASDNAPTPGS